MVLFPPDSSGFLCLLKFMKSVKTLLLSVNIFIVVAVAAVIGFTARKNMLNQITESLGIYKETLYEGYDNAVKYQVQSVIALLEGIYSRQEAGELTERAAKREAVNYIKALRYGNDKSGYFWIDNTDYILVAHPILEEQEGDNRYNIEDQNGVKIIQSIMETVQSSEEGGFNEFYYTKSDGTTVAPKRAYSMLFKPWGWIVSTGNYIDEIESVYAVREKEMDKELRWQLQMTNLCVFIMIAVSIIISFIYARKFTVPLRNIRDLAMRMSKCDFSKPVEIKSRNEFGQTAETLNHAQDILKSYIHDISRLISEMADGNFEIHAEVNYDGEFIKIYNSLKEIVNSMNYTLSKIDNAAGQVALSSGQMADMSQQLAQSTMQQAESIQDVSRLMNDISGNALRNSQNAGNAKEFVIQSGVNTENGVKMMEKLTEAIKSISEASHDIEKIIKTIDDISFQTNLLSLNASVEAERAGEAGKGFSVVASEVRNLAQKSGDSANNTHKLVENCIKAVDKGTQIAADTEKALSEILDENKKVHKLVMEIAADSEKQAADSGYIGKQIENISAATQSNSATVQQSAASSEELSRQAAIMKELVGKFHLK